MGCEDLAIPQVAGLNAKSSRPGRKITNRNKYHVLYIDLFQLNAVAFKAREPAIIPGVRWDVG